MSNVVALHKKYNLLLSSDLSSFCADFINKKFKPKNEIEAAEYLANALMSHCENVDRDVIGYIAEQAADKNNGLLNCTNRKTSIAKLIIKHINQANKNDDWVPQLLSLVHQFNKNHLATLVGGEYRILRLEENSDGNLKWLGYREESMLKIYQNTTIQTGHKDNGSPKFENQFKAWVTHEESISYRGGVEFLPARKTRQGVFNTWVGFSVKPKKSDCLFLVKQHINEVICDGNDDLIDFFYNWVAFTVQYPDRPAGSAIVIRGKKGTGKGLIGHFLRKIWGVHGFYVSQSEHVTGRFNAHLADICFLFADEAFFSGDKKAIEQLKSLITEGTFGCERKGVDVYQQRNYLKIFMCTNNDHAVHATSDERRYGVFETSDKYRGDSEYFSELRKDLNDKEVQAAFLHDMLNRDIKGFNPMQPPETIGLKKQRLESLKPHSKWLIDVLCRESFDDSESWSEIIFSSAIMHSYLAYCENYKVGQYDRLNETSLGMYLNELGFLGIGRQYIEIHP